MEITQSYIEARNEGINWLNSSKRDYARGVSILGKSGYKPVVCAKLAKTGERPHTRQKLEYEMRQLIRVWYNPSDPRFENVDLDEDAVPGEDGRPESVSEAEVEAIVTAAEDASDDGQSAYPPSVAKVIYTFAERYKQRAILHKNLAELGESNAEEVIGRRKVFVRRIAALSDNMKALVAIKRNYEENGLLPTDAELDAALAEPDIEESRTPEQPKTDDDSEETVDITRLSVEKLKKAKANAKSKITKAQNMLLYSSEIKPKDGRENPLPVCPKRVKYEKKIERQMAWVEKIEYRLAELQ